MSEQEKQPQRGLATVEEAIEEYLKTETFLGVLSSDRIVALREAYAVSGWRGVCQKRIDILKERSKKSYVPASEIAFDYIRLGENDQAFEWLQRAYKERDPMLRFLNANPIYDKIRSDPRFTALLKKMGLEK